MWDKCLEGLGALHVVSKLGLGAIVIGFILKVPLGFHTVMYKEKVVLKSTTRQTRNWRTQQSVSNYFLFLGLLALCFGTILPDIDFRRPGREKIEAEAWYYTWEVALTGKSDLANTKSITFDKYKDKSSGERQIFALLRDSENRVVGRMWRIDSEGDDFQSITGTLDYGGQKWSVRLSMLNNKASFSGQFTKKGFENVVCSGKRIPLPE